MRSWFFLLACNLMWALQFTCVKLVQDQVGPFFTVWGPMTLATLMLIPLVMWEQRHSSSHGEHSRRDALTFFLLAGLGIFPGQVLITWGTRWSLASNAALLMLTLPVSTAFLAYLFLGERMTPVRWLSFSFAIAGVVMCSEVHFSDLRFGKSFLAGNGLIFLGTLGSGFYNSYSKKVLLKFSPLQVLFYSYVGMITLLAPVVIAEEGGVFRHIASFTTRTWVGLALLTFFHNFLSMVLFLKALKQLDAIQAALSNYLITFFGVPIAIVFLGERSSLRAIIGGVIILGSTLLITLRDKSAKETPSLSGGASGG